MQEKNILFYFTGTKNSQMAAKQLGTVLGEYQLIELSQFNTKEKIEAERVGIICPVYYWGIPNIVGQFLSKVKIKADTYIFSIITMGSSAGNSLQEIDQLLQASGNHLAYGASVKFPDNYSTMLGMQKVEKHAELLTEAAEHLQKIGVDILGKKQNELSKYHPLLKILSSSLRKSLAIQDKKFRVEEDCSRCGRCIHSCPVQNIRMEEAGPVWQHHCEFCLACIAGCPEQAIQIGKKTKGRPRYQNPM